MSTSATALSMTSLKPSMKGSVRDNATRHNEWWQRDRLDREISICERSQRRLIIYYESYLTITMIHPYDDVFRLPDTKSNYIKWYAAVLKQQQHLKYYNGSQHAQIVYGQKWLPKIVNVLFTTILASHQIQSPVVHTISSIVLHMLNVWLRSASYNDVCKQHCDCIVPAVAPDPRWGFKEQKHMTALFLE